MGKKKEEKRVLQICPTCKGRGYWYGVGPLGQKNYAYHCRTCDSKRYI